MGFMSKRKHVKTNTYIYKHIDAQSPFIFAYQVSCTNNVMKHYDFTLHGIIRNITRKVSRHLGYRRPIWFKNGMIFSLNIIQKCFKWGCSHNVVSSSFVSSFALSNLEESRFRNLWASIRSASSSVWGSLHCFVSGMKYTNTPAIKQGHPKSSIGKGFQ